MNQQRYEILDGLRGVAAVYIVVYHLFECAGILLGHGYLAVDFFYALSGFVIGYAYDSRWGQMTLKDFFKRRLIRLHPMVLMGMVVGLCLFYLGESSFFPPIAQAPLWKVLLLFVCGCLMIPTPVSWDIRGWQDTNNFNGNIWSLYWEYLVNILYALIFRHLSTRILAGLALVAAVGTLDMTLFNAVHSVNGGWSLTWSQTYLGAVRLFYPFLAGLILSRLKVSLKLPGGFWSCALLVLLVIGFPPLKAGEVATLGNGIFEAFAILVVLPLIISCGAGSQPTSPKTLGLCRFLGEISYPLYITHLPLVYVQAAWLSLHPTAPTSHVVVMSAGLFVAALGLAYACSRLYDIPLRRWLLRSNA